MFSEHDEEPISPDHYWVYENSESAKCRCCGLKAEYAIYDVVCYGGAPIEKFKWMYHISERDEDLDSETCSFILKIRVTSFIKKLYTKVRKRLCSSK